MRIFLICQRIVSSGSPRQPLTLSGSLRSGDAEIVLLLSGTAQRYGSQYISGGNQSMSAMRQEEEMRNTGLTTADLANLDESSSTKIDSNRNTGLDRATADLESRQIEFRSADDPVRERESVTATKRGSIAPDRQDNSRGSIAPDRQDNSDDATPLLSSGEAEDFHARWDAVQVSFVDEPRRAVQEADGLVAGAMKRLAEIFADERARLDQQWDRGGDVSTEELRIALQRYRSFFGRLLSV
jgi:hypothetical protein